MQYETKVLTTKYQKADAYGALSMPVYLTAAFEFPNAKAMNDAFCGRSMDIVKLQQTQRLLAGSGEPSMRNSIDGWGNGGEDNEELTI